MIESRVPYVGHDIQTMQGDEPHVGRDIRTLRDDELALPGHSGSKELAYQGLSPGGGRILSD